MMVLLMTAALGGAVSYGGLGWWADDSSLTLLLTTLFGASLGGAFAAVRLILRETEAAAHAGGGLQAQGGR